MNDPIELTMDRADDRLAAIIEQIAQHFPAQAPAIRAVASHVILSVDHEVECRCLVEPFGG